MLNCDWNLLDRAIVSNDTMPTQPTEQPPDDDSNEPIEGTPLFKTAIDPHGHRSMLFRIDKTGELMTFTEINERNLPPGGPMQGWFRRYDRFMCWMLFENIRPGRLRIACQYLCAPLVWGFLGYNQVRFHWDLWRWRRLKI